MIRFTLKQYQRSLLMPLLSSSGRWGDRRGLILRLDDLNSGAVGFGEVAPALSLGSESLAEAIGFFTKLPGTSFTDGFPAIPASLPCCSFAVESALAMLQGLPAPPTGLRSAYLLPTGKPALEAVQTASANGFRTLKWKIGVLNEHEEQLIWQKMIERAGPNQRWRLDANGGLTIDSARRWLQLADAQPVRVEFVEQALPVGSESEMMRLADDFVTPLALDESIRRNQDLCRWLDAGWKGIFVLKPAIAGSPAALRLLIQSRSLHPRIVISSALETVFGAWGSLQFASPERDAGFGIGQLFPEDGLSLRLCQSHIDPSSLQKHTLSPLWSRLPG